MNNLIKGRKLGRKFQHKKAMMRNMAISLFKHERIKTTLAKAKELRSYAEKIITRSKVNSLANKRVIMKEIKNRDVIAKLFDKIGPRYKDRPGGYTRIIRIGTLRKGDASKMAIIELLEEFNDNTKSE